MKKRTKRAIGEVIALEKNFVGSWVLTIRWMHPDEDDVVATYHECTWPWIDLVESGTLAEMIETGELADPAGLARERYVI